MLNLHSTPTGPRLKSHTMPTLGIYVSQSWTRTTPSPRKSSGHKSSCLRPLLPQTIGRRESISNNAISAGNSPANTNLVCNTRTEEQKDVLHARNLAHRYADYVEARNILKPNTINPATIAFKPESPWKKSSQKIGFVHISDAQSALNHISLIAKTALNHISLIAKTAEAATTQSNKQEDVNPSRTNHSLHRNPSNNMLGHPNQYSLQDIRPSHKDPTTPGTHAPEDHTHSKTSNQMPLLDPPINNHAINLPYE